MSGGAAAGVSELITVTGQRFCVEGSLEEIEAKILNAARGSILELVWLIEAESGNSLALNPAHIVALRSRAPEQDEQRRS